MSSDELRDKLADLAERFLWRDNMLLDRIAHLTADLDVLCDEVDRLRAEVKGLTAERDFNKRQLVAEVAEVNRLRSWIDRQEPRDFYTSTICPICHNATERRYMRPVDDHVAGCPWREARRG